MALKYGKKKHRQNIILYTIVTAILLCIVFLSVVSYFYENAEEEAYDMLHIQTKQIKDDLTLQLISDRENLVSMANFAAKLYSDGESYNLMFDSFKPIGLIANIGILNPDNTFVTRTGKIDLTGAISFADEAKRGTYISGRVQDITNKGLEIVRSAVPIQTNGETVGILYGVVKLDKLDNKYAKMADELSAQLFVYEKATGNFVIDTVQKHLGNISEFEKRIYTGNFSYEKMMKNEKGYTSFISAYTGEELYIHYSPIEELGWTIMLARPESQVFARAHIISKILFTAFLLMAAIIMMYVAFLMRNEKRRNLVTEYASKIRKLLLELNQQQTSLTDALKDIAIFSQSRSAIFFDTDGEDYNYFLPARLEDILNGDDRRHFMQEILRYAAELHKANNATVSLMCITPNKHLIKTNYEFYLFLKKHRITEISFSTVIDKNNHTVILGVVNPKKSKASRILLEDVAVCFSIALYNKKHLNKTEIAATTDSLTGAANRVTYKRDLLVFDEQKPQEFSCIYIDVNELHLRNNKYGHAAGDEMLLYIANTLKEVFYGHKIYRMGGDEFLVFIQNTNQEAVKKGITLLIDQLKPMNYHVAIGMSYRTQNTNTEEMVREAEVRMYEAKAQYYQNKEHKSISKSEDKGYIQTKTGILEIDTMLSVLKEHYNGIYRVSLDTDKAHRILMPAYLGYNENEENYSGLFSKYIDELVSPDFHRAVMSFLNYDAIKRQLLDGKIPRITYKKINGEPVILSVYRLSDDDSYANNTLWVFAKA